MGASCWFSLECWHHRASNRRSCCVGAVLRPNTAHFLSDHWNLQANNDFLPLVVRHILWPFHCQPYGFRFPLSLAIESSHRSERPLLKCCGVPGDQLRGSSLPEPAGFEPYRRG